MNGVWEKIAAVIIGLWIGSMEFRFRDKPSMRLCDTRYNDLKKQNNRIESHIYDIMLAQKIKPSIEPPDEMKNNRER